MAKNWAMVVGINQYNPHNLRPLKYAKRDANLIRTFFLKEAKFEEVYFFSDTLEEMVLPGGKTIPTQATYGNLINFLHDRFEKSFLSAEDNFWFFFAGHGERHKGQDFLMPLDCNPRAETWSAIPVNYVRERLCRSGAGNVILILDACRSEGARSGIGIGSEEQQGVITISACSPTQQSWEIDELQQGVFTYALLEALRDPGRLNCATVERLAEFLKIRVSQLCSYYRKFPEQTPRIVSDPLERSHLILLPDYIVSIGAAVPQTDIDILKRDICRLGFAENKIDFAKQLCLQANAAAMGRDAEIMNWYSRLQQLENQALFQKQASHHTADGKSTKAQPRAIRPPVSELSPDNLSSAKGIDYTKLRDLLRRHEWKQADWETSRLLRELTGRTADRWVRVKDIALLPAQDLQTIDQLWKKYSNGKFGFSTQKQIWQDCGSPIAYGDSWDRFGDAVGWRRDGRWDRYAYSFDAATAPRGHFPRDFAFNSETGGAARGRQALPVSLMAGLLKRNYS